jgi:hypothetical protein
VFKGDEIMSNLKEIVANYLKDHGFGGLFHYDGECVCDLEDFMPCEEPCPDCQPGYKIACDPETCSEGGDCNYHLSLEKPTTTIEQKQEVEP